MLSLNLLISSVTCSWLHATRNYPIKTEKTFRLDDKEVNFLAEPPIKLDGHIYKTLRVGYDGYIGGTNSQRDYRIIPLLLLKYDLTSTGGMVHYTEKLMRHHKIEMTEKIWDLFRIEIVDPSILLVTWDQMKVKNSTKCYDSEVSNTFDAQLVWTKDLTFLFINYDDISAPLDCTSQKYALMEINVDQKLMPKYRHKLSRTRKVSMLTKRGNHGKHGEYAFRIDDVQVEEAYDWRRREKVEESSLL